MTLKYRKKPIVIEAFQWTKERSTDNSDWPEWLNYAWQKEKKEMGSFYKTDYGDGNPEFSIATLEGIHKVSYGDYIIKGIKGGLYPCKPDIFELSYEKV